MIAEISIKLYTISHPRMKCQTTWYFANHINLFQIQSQPGAVTANVWRLVGKNWLRNSSVMTASKLPRSIVRCRTTRICAPSRTWTDSRQFSSTATVRSWPSTMETVRSKICSNSSSSTTNVTSCKLSLTISKQLHTIAQFKDTLFTINGQS